MKKFEISFFSKYVYDTCWKFLDDMDHGCAQAGEAFLTLSEGPEKKLRWQTKATPFTCPCYSWPVWSEMMELTRYLITHCWGYSDEFDPAMFTKWVDTNSSMVDIRGDIWMYNIQTDIAVYQIRLHIDERDGFKPVSCQIAAFDRGYLTNDQTAAALIPACHDHSILPPQHDYAFAKAVLEHMLVHLPDAPAIQERLRSSIRAMEHQVNRGR